MHPKVESLLHLLETEIKNYSYGKSPFELYEPIRYIMSLGGKRLRPLLTLLAYSLYESDLKKALKPAMAVEVFHNFTLMHDDIMDNAPLRRGKTTVHEKWNTAIAILAGDVMFVKAYDLLLAHDSPRIRDIIAQFNQCAIEVCEGQQHDMNFESRNEVGESEYLDMIRQKTAVLLGFSLELGGLLADAPESECRALRDIGENIGIGFQLQDDLLDVYADTEKFGKQVGGDIIANKKTFLLLKALELAEGKEKEALNSWLGKHTFVAAEKVKAVTGIYNTLEIRQLTEERMNAYFNLGITQINNLKSSEENKQVLTHFFSKLIAREK